jgi:hypothetical protein
MKYKVKLGIHKALDSLLRKLCSKFSLSCVMPLWLISGRSLGMVGGDFQWIYDHHQCITYNMGWSENTVPKNMSSAFSLQKNAIWDNITIYIYTLSTIFRHTHINSRYQLSSRLSSASWRPKKRGNLGWQRGYHGKKRRSRGVLKKLSLQKKTISFGVRDERNRRFTSRLVQPWSNHWTDFWCFTETPRAKIAIKSRGGRQQMFPSSNSGRWKLYFVGWKFDMNKWNGHWTIPNWDVFGFLTNANNMFTFNQPKFDFYQHQIKPPIVPVFPT